MIKLINPAKMKIPYEPPTTAVILDDLTDAPESTNEDQVEFLNAVRNGNESMVRVYVLEKPIDVNCANLIGETALQIAANNDHREIAKFLVQQGADVTPALLQAVVKESVDWVKALLDFVELSNDKQNSDTSSNTSDGFSGFAKKPHSWISPLMLAAQNDCPEIVRLFLEKGYEIEESQMHKNSYTSEEYKSPLGNIIGRSIYRLNSYRALASPIYLCMSYLLDDSTEEQNLEFSNDPMVRAFLLNHKFESLVETEYEYNSDYKRLSDQCERFAVSLLEKCESVEEISSIMSLSGIEPLEHVEERRGKEAQKLSMLNFAIANKNEKVRAN